MSADDFVEFTIKFSVAVVCPVTGSDDGETAHVDPAGAPEHAKVTVPVKFGIDVNCIPSWLDCPGTRTTVLLTGAIANGAVPTPVNATVCGEFDASSTMVTFAVRVPMA